ncbi:MAG: glycosyltransferase [Chloroflexi bacterium]|nr:glycosyltransferase [Chloroflexota bacterium]
MSGPVVGYVIRMFPQASETFIANEILQLERMGARVHVYSCRRPRASAPHASVQLIKAPVTYLWAETNRRSWSMLGDGLALRRMEPERYHRTAHYARTSLFQAFNPMAKRLSLETLCLPYLIPALRLARRIEETPVDHLHAHFAHGATLVAMLASMLTGVPFSFTAHARDIFSKEVDFRLLREKVGRARFVVTVSRYNRDFLCRQLGLLAEERVRVLYNGVDLEKFSPKAGVRRERLVLAVGRLVEKKGFSDLVKASRILRDQGLQFQCEIVGDGELRQRLEREIRDQGLTGTVRLTGPRSQEELVSYYRRASVLVQPSIVAKDGNRDALPTVLLEGMACGVPAIATRLTGIPEIVDDGENGFLVEPGDAAALAGAIRRVLESKGLQERFSLAATAKAQRRFSLENNVSDLYRLFGQSVEERKVAA